MNPIPDNGTHQGRFQRLLAEISRHEVPVMTRDEKAGVIEALRICGAIEWLRAVEGDSVEILCDNPDPDTCERQCAVNCNGNWTNYVVEDFYGETVLAALEKAVAERQRRESQISK